MLSAQVKDTSQRRLSLYVVTQHSYLVRTCLKQRGRYVRTDDLKNIDKNLLCYFNREGTGTVHTKSSIQGKSSCLFKREKRRLKSSTNPPPRCFEFVENVIVAVYERTHSYHYPDEPIPGLPKTWYFQSIVEKSHLLFVEYHRFYIQVGGTVPKVDANIVAHSVAFLTRHFVYKDKPF